VAAAVVSEAVQPRRDASREPLARYSLLDIGKGRSESVTCADLDPAGRLGIVGGYLKQRPDIVASSGKPEVSRSGKMERGSMGGGMGGGGVSWYGSRLHVVDIQEQKEVLVFDTALVDRKHSYEKGTKRLLDCMFLGNWRYIVALTGNHLSLWDTERGLKMSAVALTEGMEEGSLAVASAAGKPALLVRDGSGGVYKRFEVARATGAP